MAVWSHAPPIGLTGFVTYTRCRHPYGWDKRVEVGCKCTNYFGTFQIFVEKNGTAMSSSFERSCPFPIGQFVRARSLETDVTHSYDRGVTHTYGGGVSHTCFEAFSVGLFVRFRMGG